MRRPRALILFLLTVLLLFPPLTTAQRRSGSYRSKSSHSATTGSKNSTTSGKVRVRGYTRKDGTYVRGYTRSAPKTKSSVTSGPSTRSYATSTRSTRPTLTVRDGGGRIKRSESAKREFMKRTGYPKGRPGYVIDHVVPLACGGADTPSNMQWQTVAEAKAKDRIERRGCK